jgi:cullin-associated NEDD8-dissociated protein 1
MMLEWRPVDCDTQQGVPANYIRSTLYDGRSKSGIQPGWSWFPYSTSAATLIVPGALTDDTV